jgi:hypothetical protein
MVNDSGDMVYAAELASRFPDWQHVDHANRRGFCGAVRSGWEAVASDATHLFHLEEDFLFNERVDLHAMAAILDANHHLAQLALKRQPVNHDEREAGDIMAAHPPETWTQRDGFVEHDLNFTTNPSLIPRYVTQLLLETGIELAEMAVTDQLLACGYKLGYLGTIEDPPRVHHIGEHRAAGWQI